MELTVNGVQRAVPVGATVADVVAEITEANRGIAVAVNGTVEWITRDMGRVFPEQWQRFVDGVPTQLREGNLAAAYAHVLADPDPATRERAARDWCTWDDTHTATHPGHRPDPRFEDPTFRMLSARLVTHYWANTAFLPDGEVVVGERARSLAAERPLDTILSVKRFMGLGLEHVNDEDRRRYRIVESSVGVVRFAVPGREVTPPEVSAHLLRELRRWAEAALGQPAQHVALAGEL